MLQPTNVALKYSTAGPKAGTPTRSSPFIITAAQQFPPSHFPKSPRCGNAEQFLATAGVLLSQQPGFRVVPGQLYGPVLLHVGRGDGQPVSLFIGKAVS
jgi:hypothetical protein